MKKFIYATNRSQLVYRFLITEETETEYVVLDFDTTSYELSQVKFYIDKANLCKARCEEKNWAFIVTEDFFASFSLEDVNKECDKRQIEIITNVPTMFTHTTLSVILGPLIDLIINLLKLIIGYYIME